MVMIFKKMVVLRLNLKLYLFVSVNTCPITDAVKFGLLNFKSTEILRSLQSLNRNSEVMIVFPPVDCEVLLTHGIGDINLLTDALNQI